MNGIVVDASVTLSWCFPDEQTPFSLSVLDRLDAGEPVLAPAFWPVEVLNSLLIGEKRGRIAREQTLAFLDHLQALSPTIDHLSLEQVGASIQAICRDHSLTPYDALYVELAMRRMPSGHSGSAAKRRCASPRRRVFMNRSLGRSA